MQRSWCESDMRMIRCPCNSARVAVETTSRPTKPFKMWRSHDLPVIKVAGGIVERQCAMLR